MIKVNVSDAIAQLTAGIQADQKQVRFATAVALTRVGARIKSAEELEMRDVFRNPTPYTLSGVAASRATKDKLSIEVKLKDFAAKATPVAKYLEAQVKGGTRSAKRFERALMAVNVLPRGYRIVPGAGAKLDAFGNMNRGQIVQILSYFRAFPEAGYRANITDKRKASLARGTRKQPGYAYFVGRPGNGRAPLGVWQRFRLAHGSAIKPVMIFVRSAVYQQLLDFDYVGRRIAEQNFAEEFAKAYGEAVRSAR